MSEYTWKGYVQYNGEECSRFDFIDFPVSEEMYRSIEQILTDGKPLSEQPFYEELERALQEFAEASEDDEFDMEEPDEDDYEDEDEYDAAYEEYQSALQEYEDEHPYGELWLADYGVYDPGDEKRFKERFIGRRTPVEKYADEDEAYTPFAFDEDGERCVHYTVEVVFGKNGEIKDFGDINAEALQSEGLRYSDWEACRPDYDLLAEMLAKELKIDIG